MKYYLRHILRATFVIVYALSLSLLTGCASYDIPEGRSVLEHVSVVNGQYKSDVPNLSGYVKQHPTTKWFSVIRKPGVKPVLYDSQLAAQTCNDMRMAMQNIGYLHADVLLEEQHRKKNKVDLVYHLCPGDYYTVSNVEYVINDDSISHLLRTEGYLLNSIKAGDRFSVVELDNLRKGITSLLNDRGYYHFNKEYITFDVDTTYDSRKVDVRMTLGAYDEMTEKTTLHPVYSIRNINYLSGEDETIKLRTKTLQRNTAFTAGKPYSASDLQKTYSNFAKLQAVRYTNVKFKELPDTTLLDCDIQLSTNKPSSISFQPEGTNTAGDLGVALSLVYDNRNMFKGSELFSLKMRTAYEAITGLEGYNDGYYQEYNVESKLLFPNFLAPFVSSSFAKNIHANSELSASYDLQNRPEFHRRVFSAAWRYRWANEKRKTTYRFDVLDMNYVYMPWISDTFKEVYLESDDNRNAILRYNYEDLFIMKIGFGMTKSSKFYSLRTNVETSGNILNALAHATHFKQNASGQYSLFNIAYAQYVKSDIDYTRVIDIDENNQFAVHGAIGVAYPYGNSKVLPFEKRYFTGGANSVRGWSVRSLGPGSFRGSDGRIDFINQTGDFKLDLSMEYRTKLFWKVNGALFVDAGNIWTINSYDEQPGGQFKFDEFYKQIAVAYGMGFRLNFGYFILRLDMGVKAINPAYSSGKEHFPIFHPNIRRDVAMHFAVGMPF